MRLYRSRFWLEMVPKWTAKRIRSSKSKHGKRGGDQEGNDYTGRVKIGSSRQFGAGNKSARERRDGEINMESVLP